MSRLVDLTVPFYDGMPGFSMTGKDGREIHCTARIREVLSHADTAAFYDGKCAFAYTEAQFFTSIGTRLDSPYIRYPDKRDIAGLTLEELVLPGVDTVSVDGKYDQARPVHSRLLAHDILIVEDLCHLDRLHGEEFRFFALPIPARGAASMPVRAFAEVLGDKEGEAS